MRGRPKGAVRLPDGFAPAACRPRHPRGQGSDEGTIPERGLRKYICGDSENNSNHYKQKENISEKPGTEEKVADAPIAYPAGNGSPQGVKSAVMPDKPVQRTSLKEKLEAFKVKAAGADKPDIGKAKGKEETL